MKLQNCKHRVRGNINAKDVENCSQDTRLLRKWQHTSSRSVKMTTLFSVLGVENLSDTKQTLHTTLKSNTVLTSKASVVISVTSQHSMKRVWSGTKEESFKRNFVIVQYILFLWVFLKYMLFPWIIYFRFVVVLIDKCHYQRNKQMRQFSGRPFQSKCDDRAVSHSCDVFM